MMTIILTTMTMGIVNTTITMTLKNLIKIQKYLVHYIGKNETIKQPSAPIGAWELNFSRPSSGYDRPSAHPTN